MRGETDYVSNGTCRCRSVCPVDRLPRRGLHADDRVRASCRRTGSTASPSVCSGPAWSGGGRWKIKVDPVWLLDFGTSQAEAQQALEVIKAYRFNGQCFVGRPQPSMEFYLVDGQAPEGSLAGEDAIDFDPAQLEVRQIGAGGSSSRGATGS